ncbi:MAG: hypothetical protein K2X82_25340 [Gemmataceae bacterium]|nr:hypothetical protein [Gemmataceae bacterium]
MRYVLLTWAIFTATALVGFLALLVTVLSGGVSKGIPAAALIVGGVPLLGLACWFGVRSWRSWRQADRRDALISLFVSLVAFTGPAIVVLAGSPVGHKFGLALDAP